MDTDSDARIFEKNFVEDVELNRVREFALVLEQGVGLELSDVMLDLTEETPVENAISRFRTYDYKGVPTLYLDKPFQIGEGDKASFTPRISRGGKSSFHGVFFGDMQLGDYSVPVAVKPHKADGAIRSCLSDYLGNHAVRSLNFHNLTPVGFIIDNEERAYSLTVLDESLTTLDSIDWSDFYPEIEGNPGMQEIWREISAQAAILHASGSASHGDFAARNIATSADGGVFLIDWEKSRLSTGEPRDVEVRYNHSHADLSVLLESMCLPPHADFKSGIGIFYGKEGDWWDGFCKIFFDEYKSIRLHEATKGSHHKKREKDVSEELKQLESDLKVETKMMRAICADIPPEQHAR